MTSYKVVLYLDSYVSSTSFTSQKRGRLYRDENTMMEKTYWRARPHVQRDRACRG